MDIEDASIQGATIYDIASAAGVSPSTVSRVINNKPGVKKATRDRVIKYLNEYNYSPNEAARGLVNQSSKMIGILISDMRTTHHTDGVYFIERELSKLGYCCIIFNTGREEAEKSDYIQILSTRRVEAAALIGSTFQSEMIAESIRTYMPNTPVILANGYLNLPNVYGVIADEQSGVASCVELLVKKGRRNLAFILNDATPSNLLKQNGFCTGIAQHLGTQPHIVLAGIGKDDAYRATCTLMKEHPKTDGIIYSEDLLAVSGMRALKSMGYDVPKHVSVVGINNSAVAEICTPTLTSLDNMLFDLSVTAARNLIDVLQGKHVARKVMILSTLVEREST
ncbi:MAG TPA: LacI family DNA-binding transcriptional regulator [Clostridia bacterium]|nr:LacI family DNA-binding transcriptional regulator [Clostridia bacterium]